MFRECGIWLDALSRFASIPVALSARTRLVLSPVGADLSQRMCIMPRFYFDVHDGASSLLDDFGDIFVNIDNAAGQAAEMLVSFVREKLFPGRSLETGVAVRDENGDDVYRAALIFRDWHADPDRPGTLQDASSVLSAPSPLRYIEECRNSRRKAEDVKQQLRRIRVRSENDRAELARRTDAWRSDYQRLRRVA